MATKDAKTEKEDTTAQGVASTSTEHTGDANNTIVVNNDNGEGLEDVVTPQWALDLMESNNAVIESNNATVLAIESFNENATRVVKDIMEEAKAAGTGKSDKKEMPKAVEVTINKKASYVVAKGKKFLSSVTGDIVSEGTELNDLDSERLKSLIAQGIAVEKLED